MDQEARQKLRRCCELLMPTPPGITLDLLDAYEDALERIKAQGDLINEGNPWMLRCTSCQKWFDTEEKTESGEWLITEFQGEYYQPTCHLCGGSSK